MDIENKGTASNGGLGNLSEYKSVTTSVGLFSSRKSLEFNWLSLETRPGTASFLLSMRLHYHTNLYNKKYDIDSKQLNGFMTSALQVERPGLMITCGKCNTLYNKNGYQDEYHYVERDKFKNLLSN